MKKPLVKIKKQPWQPIPNSSQEFALNSKANITFYTGARGPGKTDTQLMFFNQHVGIGYGTFWRGVIFDREYKMLDDLVLKSKRWFLGFDDGAKFMEAKSDYKWVWPTGEELLFRHYKDEKDYWSYHGQEFSFLGWNELPKYPTSKPFDDMMSCNRSSYMQDIDNPNSPPTIPLVVFATGNSYGAGHAWVKKRFITPAPYGQVIRRETEIFNPQTQRKEIITKTQVTIFGSYRENIYLSPEYIAELASITDENKRKSWLGGSWDIVSGGAFSDLWLPTTHVKPRFKVPVHWYVDRAFDWGSTQPFSVGWFAEATGEEIEMLDGSKWCPQRGSLIQISEWYGTKEIGTNVGLKMSAKDIALGIKAHEKLLFDGEWIRKMPSSGPADNQIRVVNDISVDTTEKTMSDAGVYWQHSDKSPGSRKIGMELFRGRLEAAQRGEGAGWYVTENCRAAIELIPTLPRDEENMDDVDTDAEDHVWDMLRYRVLKGNNRAATSIKFTFPT